MSADHDDEVLARLRKLSDQLETAQKSANITAKEVARAKSTTEQVKKDVRLHDTSKKKTSPKSRKRKSSAGSKK